MSSPSPKVLEKILLVIMKIKSVYDLSTTEELINRINSLSQQSSAQWGKMNVFQMLKHCTLHEDMVLGKGRTMLKKVLKDNTPFGKNSPTSSRLKTTHESGDIEHQKKEWINRIEQYGNYDNPSFVHPFFGPMTKEQIGFFAYKHNDHHLRQFGA
jgi:hypothetical protein